MTPDRDETFQASERWLNEYARTQPSSRAETRRAVRQCLALMAAERADHARLMARTPSGTAQLRHHSRLETWAYCLGECQRFCPHPVKNWEPAIAAYVCVDCGAALDGAPTTLPDA